MAEALLRRSCRFEAGEARLAAAECLEAERAVAARAVHEVLARMAGHRKDLTARHVEAVRQLLYADCGKTLSLPYGLTVRREAADLVFSAAAEAREAVPIQIGETVTFGRWTVTLRESGEGREVRLPADAALTVTLWDRNDRMTLPGSRGERSLKRLCAERGISPAERDSLPVLRVDGRCAAVPVVGIHSEFLSGEGRTVYLNFQIEEKQI